MLHEDRDLCSECRGEAADCEACGGTGTMIENVPPQRGPTPPLQSSSAAHGEQFTLPIDDATHTA